MMSALETMLTTLEMKVKPLHTALIVVDMQNDFCAKGGIFDRDGMDISMIQAMAPRLTHFISMAREIRVAIVYIQTIYYSPNRWYLSDVWLEQRKRRGRRSGIEEPACEQNSWGADFYDGIKPLPGEAVVNKHRFSAFLDTDLDLILRSKGIRTLIMTGVATDVCVETTARDGFMRDYYIVFMRDCTASTSEERHRNALKNIEIYFGEVVDSTDVLGCWKLRG
jgi:ureidoacrylate peracid hydrolase